MIDASDEDSFVARFGDLYENSSWIVRAAWAGRPYADAAAFIAATARIVREAGEEAQLSLIRAHPELARRFGVDPQLGALSAAEQAGAGLDRLTEREFAEFRALNEAYRARFDMPFVICVGEAGGKAAIRAALELRLTHSAREECDEALRQIDRIAALRLKGRLAS